MAGTSPRALSQIEPEQLRKFHECFLEHRHLEAIDDCLALFVAVDETGTVWAAWVEGGISYLRPGAGLWQDIRLPGAYAAIATGQYPVVASSSSEIRIANPGFVAR